MSQPHIKTILYVVAGSQAYGMATATSDIDVKGVALGDRKHYLGMTQTFEQIENPDLFPSLDVFSEREREIIEREKLEGTIYELRKFMKLAAACNPNLIEVLYCRDEEVRLITEEGRILRDNRDLFLSAKAKHTLSGYAMSQMNRIKRHRRWLLDPPTSKPSREDFNLPDEPLVPKNHMQAVEAELRKMMEFQELDLDSVPEEERGLLREDILKVILRYVAPIVGEVDHFTPAVTAALDVTWESSCRRLGLDDNLIEAMKRERQFASAVREWKSYETWKRNRNPARAALEAKVGYDSKHAAHAVRLFKMGWEILTKGEVHVWRGEGGPNDAEELLEIRQGAWSYEKLMAWCEEQDKGLHDLYLAKDYVVPHSPDKDAINDLCMSLIERVL